MRHLRTGLCAARLRRRSWLALVRAGVTTCGSFPWRCMRGMWRRMRRRRMWGRWAAPQTGAFPGRERVALGDALQASHFAGGEVPLEARGLRREGHLEVVSAKGISHGAIVGATLEGFVAGKPRAPTLFQFDDPLVVALIPRLLTSGQVITGGQIAICLGNVAGHHWPMAGLRLRLRLRLCLCLCLCLGGQGGLLQALVDLVQGLRLHLLGKVDGTLPKRVDDLL
mmetsp:Transcript_63300/g.100532  ORF Transcript_63300/g.100532 Transcript_63300/m.100532 type:complete len:225 (-) Transcript_63300:68-742(-)